MIAPPGEALGIAREHATNEIPMLERSRRPVRPARLSGHSFGYTATSSFSRGNAVVGLVSTRRDGIVHVTFFDPRALGRGVSLRR